VPTLPRPAEWPSQGGLKEYSAVVLAASLGVVSVPIGFGFVAIGEPGGLKYALLFAVIFLLTALLGYWTRFRRGGDLRTVRFDDKPGTEVRYSSFAFWTQVVLIALLAAVFLLASVDFHLGIPSGEVTAPQAAVVVFGLIGLVLASPLALVAAGRLRPGKLVLSPQGIYQRGMTFSSFLPWESLAGVKAVYNGRPYVLLIAYSNAPWERQQLVKLWKVDKLPPTPMIEVNCMSMAIDPDLLYWLLKFYVENPAARGELGTEDAVRRTRLGL
jgi:hypothetical protein